MWQRKYVDVSILVGVVLKEIRGAHSGSDHITFVTDTGREFSMVHYPDCCERVIVEEVIGNIEDLIGLPITLAREDSNSAQIDKHDEWTFYNIGTAKGTVTLRWCADAYSYYSTTINFVEHYNAQT